MPAKRSTKDAKAAKKSSSLEAMAYEIYLLQEERALFNKLSDSLQEGWNVVTENLHFEDTPQKQRMRLSIMRPKSGQLMELAKELHACKSEEEFQGLVERIDMKKFPAEDLTELFFGLGPDAISWSVSRLLAGAKTDEDIDAASALSAIRHFLLEHFCAIPSA
jgi:hypothetical protein